MAKKSKKRDYRAEYKRRIERALKLGYSRAVARGHARTKIVVVGVDKEGNERTKREIIELPLRAAKFLGLPPGTNLEEALRQDSERAFGRVVGREKEDATSTAYELRLETLAKREGFFDWLNEGNFIDQMKGAGLTEREAYTHWFSP